MRGRGIHFSPSSDDKLPNVACHPAAQFIEALRQIVDQVQRPAKRAARGSDPVEERAASARPRRAVTNRCCCACSRAVISSDAGNALRPLHWA